MITTKDELSVNWYHNKYIENSEENMDVDYDTPVRTSGQEQGTQESFVQASSRPRLKLSP